MRALTKEELRLISGGGAISSGLDDIEINFDDDLEFDLDVDLSGFALTDIQVSGVNDECTTEYFPGTPFGGSVPSKTQIYQTDPDKIAEDKADLAVDSANAVRDVEDPPLEAADLLLIGKDVLQLQQDSNPYINHGIPW